MKIDRLVSIILILLDKKRMGAQELANIFEVSPRTIYRDIDAVNRAGIPVFSTPGVGGGFEIMQRYKIEKQVFSTSDLSTILMGLSSLSSMVRGEDLVNALAKVRSFIPVDRAKDIEFRANQIYIDLSPWVGNRNMQPYLEILKTALQESKLLSFEYADHHGKRTSRIAEPYQLVLKNSHWYWQGYCHTRDDFRLFKLSRTSNLKMLEECFTPRENPKPLLDIKEMADPLQTFINIRIHQSVMDRVLEYCSYDHFTPDGDEHYLVRFPFIENDYYYNFLFSFGDACECLGPLSVRTEMKRRICAMATLYNHDTIEDARIGT
ncbi:helix-turn-helix transcriptional regulator [Sphaerochaeta sp.]|uniref:helix-turn-helix transcriptional regulator n=1 Tax=Sphaerochaeta sp. TaxID=1972642 RepID=UPI002FC6C385